MNSWRREQLGYAIMLQLFNIYNPMHKSQDMIFWLLLNLDPLRKTKPKKTSNNVIKIIFFKKTSPISVLLLNSLLNTSSTLTQIQFPVFLNFLVYLQPRTMGDIWISVDVEEEAHTSHRVCWIGSSCWAARYVWVLCTYTF